MKKLILAALFAGFATGTAFAASSTTSCGKLADDKKLAGADRTSFVKKCKGAANAATKECNSQAADKSLDGDRKSSFIAKCVQEATAAKLQ